jgi:hypothetical protein
LEEALLLDSSENNTIDDSTTAELAPRLIPELIVSLLQGCDLAKSWPSITTSNFQLFLRRLFRQKCEVSVHNKTLEHGSLLDLSTGV